MTDLQLHLSFIQATITRMANTSFAIKTLTVTLLAAFLAFFSAQNQLTSELLVAALFPIVILWHLDAKYLQQERIFRMLYDDVRIGNKEELFSMEISYYKRKVDTVPRIAFSWSVFWFYCPALSVIFLLYVYK
ncbi:MAG: hypothetical protein AAF478_13045 [Pseudomonadota bacterium]